MSTIMCIGSFTLDWNLQSWAKYSGHDRNLQILQFQPPPPPPPPRPPNLNVEIRQILEKKVLKATLSSGGGGRKRWRKHL